MARVMDHPIEQEQRLRMTYEEYVDYVDDSTHSEWVDGEVTIFMSPGRRHQSISLLLSFVLGGFLEFSQLGDVLTEPFEMKLRSGRSYREPDLLVVLYEHRHRLTEQRLEGAADFVIELVSPESIMRDRDEKRREYEAAGIPEYWLIDATLDRLGIVALSLGADGRYRELLSDVHGNVHSMVLPGFFLNQQWFTGEDLPSRFFVLGQLIPSLTGYSRSEQG